MELTDNEKQFLLGLIQKLSFPVTPEGVAQGQTVLVISQKLAYKPEPVKEVGKK